MKLRRNKTSEQHSNDAAGEPVDAPEAVAPEAAGNSADGDEVQVQEAVLADIGADASPEVRELLGAEREAQELLERRRASLSSAVIAEGERRLAEAHERFAAERAELERQIATDRERAEQWVAEVRETHEKLGLELEQERTKNVELEARAEENGEALEQATAGLQQAREELTRTRGELESAREELRSAVPGGREAACRGSLAGRDAGCRSPSEP